MLPNNKRAKASGLQLLAVCLLLLLQSIVLAYSATRHSPTDLEPQFLISGISHWQFNRFELYRVNPPLPRMLAAIPVLAVGCESNWDRFDDSPGSRAEFSIKDDFIRANGADTLLLLFYARWACIPFSLIGAYFAYRWARELYGNSAGLVALVLYAFDPNLLAHGELITPESATTAFGVVAGYAFWRWLDEPSWVRVAFAGLSLGLAELSKMSWLVLFGLWPILWGIWSWLEPRTVREPKLAISSNPLTGTLTGDERDQSNSTTSDRAAKCHTLQPSFWHLLTILIIGVYVINLGYAFDGFGTRLRDFQFVSRALAGPEVGEAAGNRFRGTWFSGLPIPLPKQYILGIDSQKKDFERYYLPSYLRGELKPHGGWWYFYLYGLLVKVPIGTWGLLALVVLTRIVCRRRPVPFRDELVLLAPALMLMVIVSSQTEFNRHLRYVFPSLGLLLIFVSQAGMFLGRRVSLGTLITVLLLAESLISVACVFPHHLAYFNAFAGGSKYGYRHLTGSSLDWGQDLLYVRDHVRATGQIVVEIRYSCVSDELARVVVPDFGSSSAVGRRIVVVSANCVEKGVPFPSDSRMLTPSLWIVDIDPSARVSK